MVKDKVVVKSNLDLYSDGFRLSEGFRNKIESKVQLMITEAVIRAEGNKRRTLMEYDL